MMNKFDGNRVFFTSDTHFNHTNIIRFCNRPFEDVEQMNNALISNWNRVVGPDDIVFHLGDFCLGGVSEWSRILERLNGKIYLIAGNHDINNIRHITEGLFEEVAMQMYIGIGKRRIYLNHFPYLCYSGSDNDTWQLFGHVHTNRYNLGKDAARLKMLSPRQYDVGVDNNNFTPVSYFQVKENIERQVEMSRNV